MARVRGRIEVANTIKKDDDLEGVVEKVEEIEVSGKVEKDVEEKVWDSETYIELRLKAKKEDEALNREK